MSQRHHILWYRPGEGSPRELSLPPAVLTLLLVLGIGILVALVLGGIFYLELVDRALERDNLLAENQRLRGEVSRVRDIEGQMRELQSFSQQVKRSLTEGIDLERIMEAGEEVEPELPKPTSDQPWIEFSEEDSTGGRAFLELLPMASGGAMVAWPQRWPVEGFLTRGFEPSPIDPALSHPGLDLAVQRGTPVRAAGGGVVIVADWTPRYGHRVMIDHGGKLLTVYGHNEILLVQRGDRVREGTPIALAGNSGLSTAPHLHFEVWIDGKVVDPRAILPKRGDDRYGTKQKG